MRSTAAPARAAALSWSNWAGNQRGDAASGLRPSVDEIVAAVRAAAGTGRRVKPVANGHSFTDIAQTDDQRMDLSRLAEPSRSTGATGSSPYPPASRCGPSTNIGRPTVVPGELEFAGRPSSKR